MEIINHTIKCNSRSDKFYVVPISDAHVGTKNCDMKKLKGTVAWIRATKNVWWYDNGDSIDSINFSDKRFDPRDIDDKVDLHDLARSQADIYCNLMKPIADRCICKLSGNHEETLGRKYHFDVNNYICGRLGVRNAGYNAYINISFARSCSSPRAPSTTLKIFSSHGFGGGRSVGAKMNNIISIGNMFLADIYVMGHNHEKVVKDAEILDCSLGKKNPIIIARKRLYILAGSFLKTFEQGQTSYGEIKVFPPIPTGFTKIFVEPFRQKSITGTKRHHEYIHFHGYA